jgi:hypothetical protein
LQVRESYSSLNYVRVDDAGAARGRVELKRIFVDGEEVAVSYDLVTNTPVETAPIAECHTVRVGADRFAAACRELDPLNRFLAKAVGVPYGPSRRGRYEPRPDNGPRASYARWPTPARPCSSRASTGP